jgi:hypothetical protein
MNLIRAIRLLTLKCAADETNTLFTRSFKLIKKRFFIDSSGLHYKREQKKINNHLCCVYKYSLGFNNLHFYV